MNDENKEDINLQKTTIVLLFIAVVAYITILFIFKHYGCIN